MTMPLCGRPFTRSAAGTATAARFAAEPHLAIRTVIGRAARDDDPHDRAFAPRAGLSLAGVDEELVLHRPLLAAPVAVVVDRGTAPVDPGFERGDHGVAQGFLVPGLHRARRRERVQAGSEERLVGVDVAHARYPGLIEQERLQRCGASGGHLPQRLRGELGRERLDPELCETLLQAGIVDQEGLAEAPRIGEPKLAAVV